jgi:hypothetical protein
VVLFILRGTVVFRVSVTTGTLASVVAELGMRVLKAGTGPSVVAIVSAGVKGTGVQLGMRELEAGTGPSVVGAGVLAMMLGTGCRVGFGVGESVWSLVVDERARETMIAASSASARYIFYFGLVLKKTNQLFVRNLRVEVGCVKGSKVYSVPNVEEPKCVLGGLGRPRSA